MASEGVTRIQTTTKNGEKVKVRWENVNVGDGGEIVASEGVTRIQTTTKTNGEKVEGRWENVKIVTGGGSGEKVQNKK